ncbi:MAG: hypothetical protein LIO96_03005 [Lachnospiraceae bacterium]|nr:hypothetical protein [Lachnospiraceae bacterium]
MRNAFAPIEQYQGRGQGPWTDVYALSATIYCCLTGKKPPRALDRVLHDELISPRDLGVDITPEQQKILLKGMAVNPARRCQSMEEFYAALYLNIYPAPPRLDVDEGPLCVYAGPPPEGFELYAAPPLEEPPSGKKKRRLMRRRFRRNR